jgi:hypothetical protein
MPKSETQHIDYYPPGWSEEIHAGEENQQQSIIEWTYDADPTISITLEPTSKNEYRISTTSGVTSQEETKPLSANVFESYQKTLKVVKLLVYSMNGAAKRQEGHPEFHGDEA